MTTEIFLQESQTTRPYASNKPSYIKIRPFLGALTTKNGKKTLLCHHMECIFDQKRAKTAKTRFFLELSLVFFKSKPKMQFKYAKLRRSYDRISKN